MSSRLGPDLRARLEDAAEGAVCDLESPAAVLGAELGLRIEPDRAEALAAVLALLNAARVPAAIQGAGTKAWLGNPLRGARVLVSTLRLSGIDELDAADGVVRVGAGTRLSSLADEVATAGWLLPLESLGGAAATVGGTLASGLAGPRRLGFGPVRDAVLGLDTVLAEGVSTRCGARVVKNVTGYDLAKLYVGSFGTLGVLERAWLRLHAVPASTRLLQASISEPSLELALECARRTTARAVAVVSESLCFEVARFGDAPRSGSAFRLIVEFAGDVPAVERDAVWLAGACSAEEASAEVMDGLGELQTFVSRIGVRIRFAVLPTLLAACCEVLMRGGARTLVNPVPGSITAYFEAELDEGEDPWWLDRVLGCVDAARRASHGEAVVETLPAFSRSRRDVFGGANGLSLMRTLKDRFDPNGILNPGRFVGSI